MKKIKNSQQGITTPILIILVVIIGAIVFDMTKDLGPTQDTTETENVVYHQDETVILTEEEIVEDTIPNTEGNKNPRIELITGYLDNKYSNDETVQIRFEATDPDGTIEKVEVYAGDRMIASIPTRGVTEGAPLAVVGKSMDKAVSKAVDFVDDERDDEVDTYSFRGTGNWLYDVAQCGITSGYMVIAHSEETSYDVRLTTDLKSAEICHEGSAINYMNKYFYKWDDPEAGEYTIQGVAYDNLGATKKSQGFKIKVTR